MDTPKTVVHTGSYQFANDIRVALKHAAATTKELRDQLLRHLPGEDTSEAVANATLAYRHLEDASMRLGKVLQALDGGVSVYDKATTVGAPDAS